MLPVVLALIIILSSLIIHCRSHFQPRLCNQRNASTRHKYNCICTPINGEEFNFFPFTFLLYLAFNAILCIIISMTECITYYFDTEQSIYKMLLHVNIPKLSNLHLIGSNSMTSTSIHIPHRESTVLYTLDYVLIYSILTLSIWQSFFAFYRFYTTRAADQTLKYVSVCHVLRLFIIYVIIFSTLFIIQIHYVYIIFPIVIIINFIFNLYCNWKFASILIERFKIFQSEETNNGTRVVCSNGQLDDTAQMLKKLYLLRKTLLLCCLLQSISLSAFVVIYDINITYLLTLLWCTSAAIYCTIFVRNRMFCKNTCCPPKSVKESTIVELKTVKVFAPNSSLKPSKSEGFNILPSTSICSDNDIDMDCDHREDNVLETLPSTQTKIRLTQSENNMNTKSIMSTTAPPMVKKNSSKLKIKDLDIPILLEDESVDNYVQRGNMHNFKDKPKFRDIKSANEQKKSSLKLSIEPRLTMSDQRYSPSTPDFVTLQLKPIASLKDYGFCTKLDVEIFKNKLKLIKAQSH